MADEKPLEPTVAFQQQSTPSSGGAPGNSPSVLDLLFGRLAVQVGFITQDALDRAFDEQRPDRSRSLAQILVERGGISDRDRQLIESLCERHLEMHGDDPQASLESLSVAATVSYRPAATTDTASNSPGRAGVRHALGKFGDYEILGEIARGGMGVVYKALQISLNRPVALKMIRSSGLADDEQVRRFHVEARAAAKLDHPHIVPIYEVGEANGQHFYSMAFVAGQSLNDCVKRDGPLAPRQAAQLLQTVAEAVQFAHDKGIVHRDLKPQNILLDETGQPRVADFGLAKHVEAPSEMTASGQAMGTPSYMPPEQAQGNLAAIGPGSDVYSLGATLYCLFTGRPPFHAASTADTIRQVIETEPVHPRRLNPAIPRDLETICLKCLRKEPSKRYASAAALADDLGCWLEGKPILARRVSRPERAWLWCKRRPAVSLLSVAVVLISLVGSYVAIERQNRVRANGLVERLLVAPMAAVPGIAVELEPYRAWTDPALREVLATRAGKASKPKQLRAAIGLLAVDASHGQRIYEALLDATPEDARVLIDVLQDQSANWVEPLWQHLAEGKASAPSRLRAAMALAAYAPPDSEQAGERWRTQATFVVDQLLAETRQSPADYGTLVAALEPAAQVLVTPLGNVFRNPQRNATERELATTTLARYAARDVNELAQLAMDAEAEQFAVLFPKLKQHGTKAIKLLQADMVKTYAADWQDDPLDASWAAVDPALVAQIESAGGLLSERFAFCQALPLVDFVKTAEALKASGYRPTRFRPYRGGVQEKADPPAVLVAAVWTRDGRDFRLAHGLSAEEILARDAQWRGEGFLPADAAGYLAPDVAGDVARDGAAEHYAGLWVRSSDAADDARLFVGLASPDTPESAQLREAGYRYSIVQTFLASDGKLRYSFIRRKQPPDTTASFAQDDAAFASQVALGPVQHDISLSAAAPVATGEERYTQMLAQAEQALAARPDDPAALAQRAVARCGLQQDALAVADLTAILARNATDSGAYKFRAISSARLGNQSAAAADVAEHARLVSDPSQAAYLDCIVAAWQGDATGLDRLREGLARHADDSNWLYNGACALAIASQAFARSEPERSLACAKEAADVLRRAVAAGYTNYASMRDDLDLEAIRDRAEFQQILTSGKLDWTLSSVWEETAPVESVALHGLPPDEHLARSRELIAQNYRPVAISLTALPASRATASSVWQRPVATRTVKDAFARRRAGAAIALLRQGEREQMFGALRITNNPESLTQFVHRCKARGVSASELWECVQITQQHRATLVGESRRVEDRVLYGLLLALGEFPWEEVPAALREPAVLQLQDWYRADGSSTIHGASGWLLRHWGHDELARQVDETAVAYAADREWFTLAIKYKSGGLLGMLAAESTLYMTFVVIPAGEYEVGSPADEPERESDEVRHVVRLTRPVAILDREITRGEFEASGVAQIGRVEEWSPTPAHAMVGPSWYDSVRYCRWLTERAGLGESSQCYADPTSLDPQQYPAEGDERAGGAPRNWPVSLSAGGFRIPTESEWEVASRGGMLTPYGFGNDVSLLGHYGWFMENSGKQAHEPRLLRPNLLGLFDMHGNVNEWCHDWYGANGTVAVDDPSGPETGSSRVIRGGGWDGGAAVCRLAIRLTNLPAFRANDYGCRVALVPSASPVEPPEAE